MALSEEEVVQEKNQQSSIQFEDGYIFKTNRVITSTADVALTEMVANTWDAGAYHVDIAIPENDGEELSIIDDGTGMTDEEFRARWMMLNYDRQRKQGHEAIFLPDTDHYARIAYGHNGVGRHGMFCFADEYIVETWRDNICNKYTIILSAGNEPFKIIWLSLLNRNRASGGDSQALK